MSFRDNLQHLRATRNMTQEQLAMLLGVSRQSVSKWEAERAYPEMDKLLKLCGLFECTLDELVSGNLTSRPASTASSMPSVKVLQDVTGYDQVMRTFAWKLSLGVSLIILGASLAMFLAGLALIPGVDSQNYAGVMVFVGAAVGLAFIIPASFTRGEFRKAHPFVEDFYTADQKRQTRAAMSRGLVVGIGLIMAGLIAAVLLQTAVWFSGSAFLVLAAFGAFFIVYEGLLKSRCNLEAYNRKSLYVMDESQIATLGDEQLQARAHQVRRERAINRIVMCIATAVGLSLLFIPALNAQRWFWLSWVVGGILCGLIGAARSVRNDK